MNNPVQSPVRTKLQEIQPMPPKKRYDAKRVYARLDADSAEALKTLVDDTGKDESTIIREAIIEKAKREAKLKKSSKETSKTA